MTENKGLSAHIQKSTNRRLLFPFYGTEVNEI